MKKFLIMFVVVSLMVLPITTFAQKSEPIKIDAKSAILIDASSGRTFFEKDADKTLPIASITKVMTLNLIFDAVENGKLQLDEKITVSEAAAGMGGSQAFIDAGYSYTARDLIKSIIIASANDAAVAMAEKISGSEDAFVHKMNLKAKELGMNNTSFKNCTGLPESGHYSTARDVAIMSMKLISHKNYFEWSNIWMDEIHHEKDGRKTELVNTNKLIRSLNGCDGLKTGYTSEAGFCVSTTAKRGDMRLISVILSGNTSKDRFNESSDLINYGFANYSSEQIVKSGEKITDVSIKGGKEKSIGAITLDSFFVCVKNDGTDNVEKVIELPNQINAPILKGQEVGKILIKLNGDIIGEVKLYSDKEYNKAGFLDKIKEIISFWK